MDPSNITVYILVKYHIELTEALEYSLITYKIDNEELKKRLTFLNDEFYKGAYNDIITTLFKKKKKYTKAINEFLKLYNDKTIVTMNINPDLHTHVEFNFNLYLAYLNSKGIIDVFFKNEQLANDLEKELSNLYEYANEHFNLFYIFNSLNLYVSSKVILLQGGLIHSLSQIDLDNIIMLLQRIRKNLNDTSLLDETLSFIDKKEFKEEDAYDLLNKISLKCSESENNLYKCFEKFNDKLQKGN